MRYISKISQIYKIKTLMELLSPSWFIESPIDFEHKQYVLFGYLQKVDLSFAEKQLSPWLLHTEKVVTEMRGSWKKLEEAELLLAKRNLLFINGALLFQNATPKIEEIETVKEILDFSIPLLVQRVHLGRVLHKKTRSLLF
jgi:hypothetical protein